MSKDKIEPGDIRQGKYYPYLVIHTNNGFRKVSLNDRWGDGENGLHLLDVARRIPLVEDPFICNIQHVFTKAREMLE